MPFNYETNFIIPAAGLGTRLRPLSSNTSKAMVKLNGKPTICYIIDKIKKETDGQYKAISIVCPPNNDIKPYLDKFYPNENIIYNIQHVPNGPAEAISIGFNGLDKSHPLVVWLCDTIVLDNNLPIGENFLATKKVDDHNNWCMWDGKSFYNKPNELIKHGVALVGIYGFDSTENAEFLFTTARASKENPEISDALELLLESDFKNVEIEHWLDTGQLKEFYKTSAELLSKRTRAFNGFDYNPDTNVLIKKTNNDSYYETLESEFNWYKNIPKKIKPFVPQVYNETFDGKIEMSYEPGITLTDLFLYEDMSYANSFYIFDKLFTIIEKNFNDSAVFPNFRNYTHKMWVDKSIERLDKTKLPDNIKSTLMDYANYISLHTDPVQVMFGDLHGSNIIYEPHMGKFKFLDPRGNYGGKVTTMGDNLYDFAKLAHDFYCGYGAIVNGVDNYPKEVGEAFKEALLRNNHSRSIMFPFDMVLKAGVLLLATCIPLHYDSPYRQTQMLFRTIECVEILGSDVPTYIGA